MIVHDTVEKEVSKLKLLHQKSIQALTAMNDEKIAAIKKQTKIEVNQLLQQKHNTIKL